MKPLSGAKICVTGVNSKEEQKAQVLISELGGVLKKDLNLATTCLLVKQVGSTKHQVAQQRGMPCVEMQWLTDCYVQREQLPFDCYVVKAFTGLTFCLTSLFPTERHVLQNKIVENGGKMSENNSFDLRSVTHLLCGEPIGQKYEYAKRHGGIKIVSPDWIDKCVRERRWSPEEFNTNKEVGNNSNNSCNACDDKVDEENKVQHLSGQANIQSEPINPTKPVVVAQTPAMNLSCVLSPSEPLVFHIPTQVLGVTSSTAMRNENLLSAMSGGHQSVATSRLALSPSSLQQAEQRNVDERGRADVRIGSQRIPQKTPTQTWNEDDLLSALPGIESISASSILQHEVFFIAGFSNKMRDYLLRLIIVSGGRRHHLLTLQVTKILLGEYVDNQLIIAASRHPTGAQCVNLSWLFRVLQIPAPGILLERERVPNPPPVVGNARAESDTRGIAERSPRKPVPSLSNVWENETKQNQIHEEENHDTFFEELLLPNRKSRSGVKSAHEGKDTRSSDRRMGRTFLQSRMKQQQEVQAQQRRKRAINCPVFGITKRILDSKKRRQPQVSDQQHMQQRFQMSNQSSNSSTPLMSTTTKQVGDHSNPDAIPKEEEEMTENPLASTLFPVPAHPTTKRPKLASNPFQRHSFPQSRAEKLGMMTSLAPRQSTLEMESQIVEYE